MVNAESLEQSIRAIPNQWTTDAIISPDFAVGLGTRSASYLLPYPHIHGQPVIRVIQSGHDHAVDAQFILPLIRQYYKQGTTFFLEGAYTASSNNIEDQLQFLDLEEDAKKEIACSQALWKKKKFEGPFGAADKIWQELGGVVVNPDLRGSIAPEIIDFLINNTSPARTVEFLYQSLYYLNLSHQTRREVLRKALPLPMREIETSLEKLADIYADSKSLTLSLCSQNAIAWVDNLREKYMRAFLNKRLTKGDILLAHFNHVRRIISGKTYEEDQKMS